MTDEHPPALLELLDLARTQVRPEQLGRYVMNDPGTGGYILAFTDVLRRGLPAIEPKFDLTENLGGGVNWEHAGTDADFRWFRVLTSTVGLILRGEFFVRPTHQLLAPLLVDCVALGPPPRSWRSPTLHDVLTRMCHELPPRLVDPREAALFVLAGLILHGTRRRDADRDVVLALCADLERISHECEKEGELLPDGEWFAYPYHARSTLGPWGWSSDGALHPVWLDLVAQHFPTEPEQARLLRLRILADGAKWAKKPRRLS